MLRPIGNSVLVRLTVIIPLVGYLIIFNEKLVGYVDLIHELGRPSDKLGLSVSPRLFQIYFGLCFVAVASAIRQVAAWPAVEAAEAGGARRLADTAAGVTAVIPRSRCSETAEMASARVVAEGTTAIKTGDD
jgi:hypothetical protein